MDITVNEKVRFKDILLGLKDIFGGSKSNESDEKLNQKLQEIYKVQSELGATKNIAALEKDVETHDILEDSKKKKSSRISTKKVISSKEEKVLEKEEIDTEKFLDR